MLKPGGHVAILEFGQPQGIFWRTLFRLYSRIFMPLIGGYITGNQAAYQYLPQTSERFPCRQDFVAILKDAGFNGITFHSLSGGIAYIYGARAA